MNILKIVKQNEIIQVRLDDGRTFDVDFWAYTKKMLGITITGENSKGGDFCVDVGVDPETEMVTGELMDRRTP